MGQRRLAVLDVVISFGVFVPQALASDPIYSAEIFTYVRCYTTTGSDQGNTTMDNIVGR